MVHLLELLIISVITKTPKQNEHNFYNETQSSLQPHEIQAAFDLIEVNNKINGTDIPSLPS